MNGIFDSILLNSLQMESNTTDITLDCTVFESGVRYDTAMVLSSTAMNRLLSELSNRDIELDFDGKWDELVLPGGDLVFHMDLKDESPVYLPLHVMPESVRLMRA